MAYFKLDNNLKTLLKNKDINKIKISSKEIKKGDIFLCVKGTVDDGHNYINEAIKRGVRVIIGEKNIKIKNKKVNYIKVKDTKKTLLNLINFFYRKYINKAEIIGITGTKGKTTVSYVIDALLREQNKKLNTIIGTVKYVIGKKEYPAATTTPSLLEINRLISESIKNKIYTIIMEISSHALAQGRVANLKLLRAVITNITRDHLDYHKTFNAYFAAKMKILNILKKDGRVILNLDDKHADKILKIIKAKKLKYTTYSMKNKADIKLLSYKTDINGSKFILKIKTKKIFLDTPLIGLHNIYNIMAAIGAVYDKLTVKSIKRAIKNFKTVRGRLEKIYDKKFFVFIDYAHTPDSMEKVLETLYKLKKGRIISVFGAGGNRDKGKRPLMGAVASKYSDVVIITSDNPRFEKPQAIINDILKGIKNKENVIVKSDRKQALKIAILMAKKDDIVVIMGKGHETYQIIGDKKIKFNDAEVVLNEIRKLKKDES